jgi:hypothetical protein
MKSTRFTLSLTALVLGAALVAPGLRAASPQKGEGTRAGKARLVAPVLPGKGGEIRIPVTIDITDVQIDGRLAVLGAYVVAFPYDKTKVAFVGVARGESPEFEELPSATPVEKANAMGIVKVVSDQSQENAPTGAVSVAVLTFRELVPGGAATIKPRIDSIASSLRKDREGRFITDLKIPVEPQQ